MKYERPVMSIVGLKVNKRLSSCGAPIYGPIGSIGPNDPAIPVVCEIDPDASEIIGYTDLAVGS